MTMGQTDMFSRHLRQTGFTLVELMIALVLGLIVIGGVISVFLANQQSYRTNEALSEVQDGSRVAFELLARDIRKAGGTPCGNGVRVANVLGNSDSNGGSDWWANWANAFRGYDQGEADPAVDFGTAEAERVGPVGGADSIQLISTGDSGYTVDAPSSTAANFKLNEPNADLSDGDIIMVCDPMQATILQVTNYQPSNVTVVHQTGNGSPGNCSKGLGYPTDCSSTTGTQYTYENNAQLAQLDISDWYIGNNPVGGRSLYRVGVSASSGNATAAPQEMVRNVTNMQLAYLQTSKDPDEFIDATEVTDWQQVTAVQVTLTLQSNNQRAGTDQQPLTRSYTTTVTLRSRVS